MDFIERSFGFSPDNGTGSIELLLIGVACAAVAYLLSLRTRPANGGLRPE